MLCGDLEESGKELCRRGVNKTLTDDVLLKIFCFYRDGLKEFPDRPWKWHTLVHVCRSWRHIVFASPRHLDLQLLCTVGTPVRKYLDCWPPTLPIVISYKFLWHSPPSSEDEDNILTALENPDRVCSIELAAPRSFLEKVSGVMQEPFHALTNLRFWSSGHWIQVPIVSQGFLDGSTCLQRISFRAISFPALPDVILSFGDLVELRLVDIPTPGSISPEAMVDSLSNLLQLKTLEIGFSSRRSCKTRRHPLPPTRSTLSTLTEFAFRGSCGYLEALVARMDTPSLHECYVGFFLQHRITFYVPQLFQFIRRTEGLRSPDKAVILSGGIGLSLTVGRSTGDRSGSFSLNIPFYELDRQIPSLAHICSQSLPLLSGVKRLSIDSESETDPEGGQVDVDPAEWRRVFRPFAAVEELYVSEPLGPQVALSLPSATGQTEIMPALRSTFFEEPWGFTFDTGNHRAIFGACGPVDLIIDRRSVAMQLGNDDPPSDTST
ncbi:hypothetical protein EDB89DRAFT_2245129 [Lactarius sanguifluus]|nr:hypothetical protein EDB89DRAFT_2245129 [Lactarius sanguifluus]